jgi:hypothetical protein
MISMISAEKGWWPGAYRPHTLGPDCWCIEDWRRACWLAEWIAGRYDRLPYPDGG